MDRVQILEKITTILADLFDIDMLDINEDTTANDVEGWDSLMHINVILAIEEEFGVSFAISEVKSMTNIGSMITIIQGKE